MLVLKRKPGCTDLSVTPLCLGEMCLAGLACKLTKCCRQRLQPAQRVVRAKFGSLDHHLHRLYLSLIGRLSALSYDKYFCPNYEIITRNLTEKR